MNTYMRKEDFLNNNCILLKKLIKSYGIKSREDHLMKICHVEFSIYFNYH